MFQVGKLDNVIHEMDNIKFDVLGLEEEEDEFIWLHISNIRYWL